MADEEKDERIYKVVVLVSDEEQERLKQVARLRGLSTPALLRMLGLDLAREILQP